jgi:hypothetical protein
MAIPTGLGSLTVNAGVDLTVVLETQDGNILLGNNEVAGKTFTCYGNFYTVNASGAFDKTRTERLFVGGSVSYKCASLLIRGDYILNNVHFGQDTASVMSISGGYILTTPKNVGYLYNGSTKPNWNNTYISLECSNGSIFDSCTIYGNINGDRVCISNSVTTYPFWGIFINCIFSTVSTYFFAAASGSPARIDLVGTNTGIPASIYGAGHLGVTVNYYRLAYFKTLASAVALGGVAWAAIEATEPIPIRYLVAGTTGTDGLADEAYIPAATVLQKTNTYIRTTAGGIAIASPTTTTNYGNYTFVFYKSGYAGTTVTHDFTDGADYGTATVPIEVTLAADKVRLRFDGSTFA